MPIPKRSADPATDISIGPMEKSESARNLQAPIEKGQQPRLSFPSCFSPFVFRNGIRSPLDAVWAVIIAAHRAKT